MRLRLLWMVLPVMLLAADDKKAADQTPKSSLEAVKPGAPAGANKTFVSPPKPLPGVPASAKNAGDKPPKPSPEAAENSPLPGVPAGAKKVGPYHWRYVDPQGKSWIYRETPFGVAKFPDEKAAVEEAPPSWKAVEAGDEIQFERPTPFGGMRWTRKKDQLNDLERKVWERDRPKAAAPAKPAEDKRTAKE